MTPYYADDYMTLYHGDCRELLPGIEADVVVGSQPSWTLMRSRPYGGHVDSGPIKTIAADEGER